MIPLIVLSDGDIVVTYYRLLQLCNKIMFLGQTQQYAAPIKHPVSSRTLTVLHP